MKCFVDQKYKMAKGESLKDFIVNHKMAIGIISILAIAGITTGFIFLEINRSERRMILATTTSTYDSGLLDYILPEFEKDTGIQVDIVSVGTGQALETGRKGDADMILVHARSREDLFVSQKYGIHRVCVMYNDFILVGPTTDPAKVSNANNVTDVMNRIYKGGLAGNTTFYSRGDDSGTHTKEKSLWNATGLDQKTFGIWYKELGSGMGDTLVTTNNDPKGYTLADRGTWLSAKDNLDFMELRYNSSEVELLNPYGAIPIDPYTHPHVKYIFALQLTSFLVSEKCQNLIGNYTVNQEKLFTPAFGICNHTHNCPTTQEEIDFWTRYNGGFTQTI